MFENHLSGVARHGSHARDLQVRLALAVTLVVTSWYLPASIGGAYRETATTQEPGLLMIELQICPGYVKQQRLQSHYYNRDDESGKRAPVRGVELRLAGFRRSRPDDPPGISNKRRLWQRPSVMDHRFQPLTSFGRQVGIGWAVAITLGVRANLKNADCPRPQWPRFQSLHASGITAKERLSDRVLNEVLGQQCRKIHSRGACWRRQVSSDHPDAREGGSLVLFTKDQVWRNDRQSARQLRI
jgi:hypothetical protein